jgi:amino acid adenylation domain-containing protein
VEAARQSGVGLMASPLRRVERKGDLPLSFAQERLWFLDQLEPGSAAYNIPGVIRIKGTLQVEALERVINEMVWRHEALRTRFEKREGAPVEVIEAAVPLKLEMINLEGMEGEEQGRRIEELAKEEGGRPFDLARGPLLRMRLARLGELEHVLYFTMHHIVSDGWSMGVLVREFVRLYEVFSQGQPSPLGELAIQYVDYAVWQRGWLQGEVLAKQLGYWQERLAGAPVLELPTDRPRPAVQSYRGASERVVIDKELLEGLNELSRRQGVTLFMTLSAAFKVLLNRYSGQEDIVVGSPIANRNRAETEGLIGFFANTLALRTDLSGDPTFEELLKLEREVALGAYGHQDVPFEKVVEELHPERDMSRSPLFQVMLVLQNAPEAALKVGGLEFEPVEVEQRTAKFDLTLTLNETGAGLSGSMEYCTELYDRATIERMVGHWEKLLGEVVGDPGKKLSELEMLSPQERHQLLVEWNDTRTDYPKEKCIHELFEEQAERTPDNVAVVFEDKQLSYRELNERSNQLANYLWKLGVGPEVLVGICVERSLEMVIGLLGILKAGGAYMPLDPQYPKERLAFMLADANVKVLLTQERLVKQLPEQEAAVVCVDTQWEEIAKESRKNLLNQITPQNLVYVIYTSGSTGRPKGTEVIHLGVVRLVRNTNYVTSSFSDVFLQFAPISFDASTFEIWGCLLNGAKLVIFPPHTPSLVELGGFIQKSQITILWLTANLFQQIVEDQVDNLLNIRQLLAGGDVLSVSHVKNAFGKLNDCRLLNGYGPTENTTFTSCHYITTVDTSRCSIPIGRPISNTEIYLLDRQLEPVPIGVTGELYIGGDGLARGYMNRPELTGERFIPNPFGKEPGERLYRTGDLGRYLPDGNIEFIGRVDHQVKIRGYRIELGEIEAILNGHPGVGQAVVVAREDEGGDKVLVGYVVAGGETTVSVEELRSYLKGKLPEYMVPSFIVMLESLPLTPNGKVDWKALPAPEGRRSEKTYIAPRTPTEEMVAGIYQAVLKVEQVGIHDNFFELGGHSLLATRLVSRVREVFLVEMPLRSLFEAPTVAGISEKVEAARQSGVGLMASPLRRVERKGDLPLSFAQERLWFLYLIYPEFPFNMRLVFRIEGNFNLGLLRESFYSILKRHEMLRTSFRVVDGLPRQVITPDLALEIPLVELSNVPSADKEARRLIEEDVCQPFDLAECPLFRVKVFHLGHEHHIFMLVMHHILADGWSIGVLVREFEELYEAFSNGQPSPLPGLPIQYADFAVWQRDWLQGKYMAPQLEYWKGKLGGDLPILELPTNRPRLPVPSRRGAIERFTIDKKISDKLKRLSQQNGVTLFMTLLTAFDALLYRYTSQEDIFVGTHFANRNRTETEGLIGFFINRLLLRSNLSGDPIFDELLQQTREVTLQAYMNGDIPFERVAAEIKHKGDLNRTSLFQVMIVLENELEQLPTLSGLKVSAIEFEQVLADVDIYLSFSETSGGLQGSLQYNTDIFDRSRIISITKHLLAILNSVISNPRQRVSDLEILSKEERQQLLEEWNDTRVDYPKDKCIHELFEEQAERTPENVAVVYEDKQLTYRELNERSNQLAHYLRKLGVEPEVLVGICVERSLEMIVGLLGILKAGGAYVPLDPQYPKERLAFMLEDARVKVVLTQERFRDRVGRDVKEIVCLESWMAGDERKTNLEKVVWAKNMAYMIYTSGSTGYPKGAINTHEGIRNRLQWMQDVYRLGVEDRVVQKTPYTFDVSVWEFFWPLMSGSRLVMAQPEGHKDVTYLIQLIERERITTVHFVPSMLQVFLEEVSPGMCSELKRVICSGESLPHELVRRFFERLPGQLHNLYGPTEASVDVTYWACPRHMEGEVVPIGKPIANMEVYILDEHLNPVPEGVMGEIYLGGVGLGRGYFGRVELTGERFIPNPFGKELGERMYRTGDLGRYLSDGNIEFIGRKDHQVKVRGYRIELGEVESVLGQHPAVQQSIVIAREDESGNKQMVGYVTLKEGRSVMINELREYLKGKLPEYMVPPFIVVLDKLPLTPNGKVDRKALPAPDRRQEEGTFIAPQTPSEELLVEIYQAVLKVERVGIHDNFFGLGGHSLLATQLVSRVREVFKVELPLRTLFENPTIVGLSGFIMWAAKEKIVATSATDPHEEEGII